MNVRRVIAALIGGAAGIFVGALLDIVGSRLGLWHYTTPGHPDRASILIYIAYGVIIAVIALIAAKVANGFGGAGFAVFLGLVAVSLAVSDFLGSYFGVSPQVITGGATAFLYDVLLWALVNAIAFGVMSWIARLTSSSRNRASQSASVSRSQS